MSKSDLDKYFKIASNANLLATSYLLNNFGSKKKITQKSDYHFGIEEDIASNSIYEKYLRKYTPEVGLYTEEGERDLSKELSWIVDPIEGTSNYRAGNPFWATQIALISDEGPLFSIVNAPVLKQKYFAKTGGGAYLNNKKINVSSLKEMDKALVDMVRGTKDSDKDWFVGALGKIIKKVRTTRYFGACGLQICFCAAGVTDVFLSKGAQIYDYVPGSLILTEAGGLISNFKGEKWKVGETEFLAANKSLTDAFLKIIK